MIEPLIFERSKGGRRASAQAPLEEAASDIPSALARQDTPNLPEVSELQAVRHYTRRTYPRSADPRRTMPVHERHALRRQLIEVRGLDLRVLVAVGNVGDPHVIRVEDDHVGALLGGRKMGGECHQQNNQASRQGSNLVRE